MRKCITNRLLYEYIFDEKILIWNCFHVCMMRFHYIPNLNLFLQPIFYSFKGLNVLSFHIYVK